ncbi:hypothetical protein T492DRAFT_841309 [Pavlovales sp. CCMP2436]|nr:hypothetical protein T492DRAFT_841309 [Pavlovales sp. CCMP2436]
MREKELLSLLLLLLFCFIFLFSPFILEEQEDPGAMRKKELLTLPPPLYFFLEDPGAMRKKGQLSPGATGRAAAVAFHHLAAEPFSQEHLFTHPPAPAHTHTPSPPLPTHSAHTHPHTHTPWVARSHQVLAREPLQPTTAGAAGAADAADAAVLTSVWSTFEFEFGALAFRAISGSFFDVSVNVTLGWDGGWGREGKGLAGGREQEGEGRSGGRRRGGGEV